MLRLMPIVGVVASDVCVDVARALALLGCCVVVVDGLLAAVVDDVCWG